MDFKRGILYFILAILGMMLWHAWQQEYSPALSTVTAQTSVGQPISTNNEYAPIAYGSEKSTSHAAAHGTTAMTTATSKEQLVDVKTDVLSAQINLHGGSLVSVKLLRYPISLEDKKIPVSIFNADTSALYIAQSGVSASAASKPAKPIVYRTAQSSYTLQNGEQRLLVTLIGKTDDGITITKNYSFYRNDYAIATSVQLTNTTGRAWQGNIYNQISRRDIAKGGLVSRSYDGASISTPNTPYKKLTYEDMSENDLSRDLQNSWIAMQQAYFLSAWIAPKNQTLHYYSRSFGHGDDGAGNVFVLGFMSPMIQLAPSATSTFQSTLYVGPEVAKNLATLGKGLDLTVDYGWLSPISKLLFWLLSEIDYFIGNWGWSIVFVTVVIKIVFYWFSNKSYASMAKTRDLQPKIKALRDRFGDDKQAMSKAMMELYRTEKVNPIGGCLPMLIQIPVFIALYYVLIESVELRQAPWIFWIQDLSMKDPYFVLPVLMGLSMFLQQKLSPPPPDPAQAKMMMFLPVIFTVFFATFPAGLVLYWLTNNCVSVLHQWYAMKAHNKRKATRTANR